MVSLASPEWIKAGFESTGLFPLNKERINVHNFEDAFGEAQASKTQQPLNIENRTASPTHFFAYNGTGDNSFPISCYQPFNPSNSIVVSNCNYSVPEVSSQLSPVEPIVSNTLVKVQSDNNNFARSCLQTELAEHSNAVLEKSSSYHGWSELVERELNPLHSFVATASSKSSVDFRSASSIQSNQITELCDESQNFNIQPISLVETVLNADLSEKIHIKSPISKPLGKISLFKVAAEKFSIRTPFDQYVDIIGKEQAEAYEEESYSYHLELSEKVVPSDTFRMIKNQYETYLMLKSHNEYLRTPPQLPKPKPSKRLGKRNTVRKPYVVTSNEWMMMTNNSLEEKEKKSEEKENRKRKREENKNNSDLNKNEKNAKIKIIKI